MKCVGLFRCLKKRSDLHTGTRKQRKAKRLVEADDIVIKNLVLVGIEKVWLKNSFCFAVRHQAVARPTLV